MSGWAHARARLELLQPGSEGGREATQGLERLRLWVVRHGRSVHDAHTCLKRGLHFRFQGHDLLSGVYLVVHLLRTRRHHTLDLFAQWVFCEATVAHGSNHDILEQLWLALGA